MAQNLRANTEVKVRIGPFPDVGDGFTPQTDITLGGNEAELLKHNGVATVDISGRTWAAITGVRGWYDLTLTTTDTNTEGLLDVVVQDDSDCLPVVRSFMVMAEAAWDSLYVAKDDGFMDVNIKTVGRVDTQETEANNLESACAAYGANRGLAGNALPDAAADAAGGVMISDGGGFDADELYDAIVTDAAGANIAVDIIAVKAETALIVEDTNELQADDYPTSIAAVQTTVDAIEVDTGTTLDTLIKAIPTNTELAAAFTEIKGATWAAGTDTLEHIRNKQTDIETDTNELQVNDIPGTLTTIAAYLDTEIAAIVAAVVTNAAGADVAADIIALKAETALIVSDTNELQTDDLPTLIATAQADLDTITGADGATLATAQALYAPNVVVPATKAEMDTAHALLATPAQVNAQVLDVLNVDTFAEPGDEAPAATTTLVNKIGYLFKFLRNKVESTANRIHVYNDAGDNKDHSAVQSDDGTTYTRNEFGAGD